MNTTIPFADFSHMHMPIAGELRAVFNDALKNGRFVGGPAVKTFESEFASAIGVSHAVGVGSGTDALRFALMAVGVGNGELVVTVPNTFIATVEGISQAAATPVFIDIDPRTFTMSPQLLAHWLHTECEFDSQRRITLHTQSRRVVRALVVVHLYGQPADMDPIQDLAREFCLTIVEDACQAHGAAYFSRHGQRWIRAGAMGAAGAFSFYPGKNLGALGEAGAVTTPTAEVATRVRLLSDHGQPRKYVHDIEGYNGRLDALQAGFLSVKLAHLNAWNDDRRRAAHVYDELLRDIDEVAVPAVSPDAFAVYHLYVVRAQQRDLLREHLTGRQIETGLHYPIPLHFQKAYAHMGLGRGCFPETERAANEILSLPMFPGITESQQRRVAEAVASFYAHHRQIYSGHTVAARA